MHPNDLDADFFERADHGRGPDIVVQIDPASLDHVLQARRRLEAAQQELRDAVAEARRDGVPWEGVGAALGVSRQAAHAKYAKFTG